MLADGQILVGGSFFVDGKTAYTVRLSKDGKLDKTYSGIGHYSRNPPQLVRTAHGKVFAIIAYDDRMAGGFTKNFWYGLTTTAPSMIALGSSLIVLAISARLFHSWTERFWYRGSLFTPEMGGIGTIWLV